MEMLIRSAIWAWALLVFMPFASHAEKAPFQIKDLSYREKIYGWSVDDRDWKKDLSLVKLTVESKEKVPLTIARVYYYDQDKKQIGVSKSMNNYYSKGEGESLHGAGKLKELSDKGDANIYFALPDGLDMKKDVSRMLAVIGNEEIVKVEVVPPADPMDFEFEEKALYEKSK